MNQIKDVGIKQMEKSKYIQPYTMEFLQNGEQKSSDLINTHNGVAVLIYHPKRDSLIFVKQFRPSVYFSSIPFEKRHDIDIEKYPPELGITLELCAGIVDKNKPLVEIAREEILEECGYDVPIEKIKKIYSCGVIVGFYCEVDDEMKMNKGGGVGDELIEVVEMTIPEVRNYIEQERVNSPASFLFAVYWFLYNKNRYCYLK